MEQELFDRITKAVGTFTREHAVPHFVAYEDTRVVTNTLNVKLCFRLIDPNISMQILKDLLGEDGLQVYNNTINKLTYAIYEKLYNDPIIRQGIDDLLTRYAGTIKDPGWVGPFDIRTDPAVVRLEHEANAIIRTDHAREIIDDALASMSMTGQ